MLFYKIRGLIGNTGKTRVSDEKYRAEVRNRTEEFFNYHRNGKAFFAEAYGNNAIIISILKSKEELDPLISKYCKHIGFVMENADVTEITMKEVNWFVGKALSNGFIDESGEIRKRFRFDNFLNYAHKGINLDEMIIEESDEVAISGIADKQLVGESLKAEVKRIFAGRVLSGVKGHPVQYVVTSCDKNSRDAAYLSILSSLYVNDRLESSRYSIVDIKPDSNIADKWLEVLYKCSAGGSIVIKCHENEDNEYCRTSGDVPVLRKVAELMKQYRNDTLTVVCFENEGRSTWFRRLMDGVSVIHIVDGHVDIEKAKTYFRNLAKDNNVTVDIRLIRRLDENKQYDPRELRKIFETWYDEYLKLDVYPQYKNSTEEIINASNEKSGYEELKNMVGLDTAKEVIEKAINFFKVQKLFSDRGICTERPSMHMVFTGNPGTAKTTVARLFAKIMEEEGILKTGILIEVGRADLVGKYVGWTAQTIKDKFAQAQGGVLFIDEAYSLVDDRDGSFGDEAINTIVQEMENHRDDVAVIFAGYPDKMEEFLNKNPGLRSRIVFYVPFSDYDTSELKNIAEEMCKHFGLRLSRHAKDKVESIVEAARRTADFGNGRFVRNMVENARMNQAGRIIKMDVDSVSDDVLCTLEESDFEFPVSSTLGNICACA